VRKSPKDTADKEVLGEKKSKEEEARQKRGKWDYEGKMTEVGKSANVAKQNPTKLRSA